MRRLARRQQGQQRPQGGAQVRPRGQGLQVRDAREALRARRCRSSSSGTSTTSSCSRASRGARSTSTIRRRVRASHLDGGARRLLLGRRPDVRAGPGVQEGRRRRRACGARSGAGSSAPNGPCSSRSSAGCFLVVPGLVDARPSRGSSSTSTSLGSQDWIMSNRCCWAMAGAVVVHGVLTWLQEYYLLRLETKLALTTSSQFLQPHPAAAGAVLRPALRRRDRLARARSTTRSPT